METVATALERCVHCRLFLRRVGWGAGGPRWSLVVGVQVGSGFHTQSMGPRAKYFWV
jgi:hypothetical protein